MNREEIHLKEQAYNQGDPLAQSFELCGSGPI